MIKHWESTLNKPLTCPKDGVHLILPRLRQEILRSEILLIQISRIRSPSREIPIEGKNLNPG